MPTEQLLQEILTEVKSVKSDVSTLRDDVSTLRDDVSTLKEDFSTLKDDVFTLKGNVSTLTDDVSILKLDVSNIKSTMVTKDEFTQAIREQQQDVMKILELTDKKMDRVESEIKSIRRDIRTIEAVTVKNWNEILDLKEAK
ncbi:prominin family protein [Pelosinus baikalensis]|uniref:Prominin family protein n=1 Tax=Pelosinus baikalensis TaxID=2892015 RepID=A0ABS8HLL5_9FIRM|nr:prominin family protein [Pelosinus baikalensis]MCC5464077.1 prominin family protein [Pelosinus baikalensis]